MNSPAHGGDTTAPTTPPSASGADVTGASAPQANAGAPEPGAPEVDARTARATEASASPPTGSARTGSATTGSARTTVVSGGTATVALLIVLIAAFMDLLDATIVTVAAPAIVEDLGAGESALQWTLAGYTLALGSGLITGGRLGDQFGRRRMFLCGLTAFTVCSATCALAPTPAFLVATRVLQGLAGGLMVPQVLGIIHASFTAERRARALGAYGAVLGLASVAGPLLGGVLVDADLFGLGWRTIFWVNVPVGAVGLLAGLRVLPESRATPPGPGASRPAPLDVVGALLASATVVLVLLPLVQGREWGWPWWGFGLLALSVPTAGAFLVRGRRLAARAQQPVLDPALLRVRAFGAGTAVSLLFFGSIGSYFFLLALYLQLGTGRSALDTGLVLVPYAVGSALVSGVGVQFAARAGRALLVSGAVVLALAQVMLLSVVRDGADPSYLALAVPLFVGGVGLGLTAPSLINVVLAGVPGKDAGSAAGVLTTVGQIGNAVGIAALGVLFFDALEGSFADGGQPLRAYGDALTAVLPWQIGCYVLAAGLMLLLPARATPARH